MKSNDFITITGWVFSLLSCFWLFICSARADKQRAAVQTAI